ncbi:MAG: PIN domain-containing protein [Terriglobales bacterium]
MARDEMRTPSPTLIVDASIIISAALAREAGAFERVRYALTLTTTERVIEETRRRVELGLKRPELLRAVDTLAAAMIVVPMSGLMLLVPRARLCLRDAVQSRNGSMADAHLLALAWTTGGDIWSADRDFAGTGVASWSTANLLRALAEVGS